MVGIDDLRRVLLAEREKRETGKLTQIPQDLFERTHAAAATLVSKVYAIEDPLSEEARTLIEETLSIRETAHDIFVIRSRKILALAESHAEGNYIDREEMKRMIPQEREMFDRIAGAIGTCQGTLLLPIQQSLPAQHAAASAMSQEHLAMQDTSASPPEAPVVTPPYTLVRVLADMDAFMGVDGRIYALAKGDIAMLPERNAAVLVERNIALNMNLYQ